VRCFTGWLFCCSSLPKLWVISWPLTFFNGERSLFGNRLPSQLNSPVFGNSLCLFLEYDSKYRGSAVVLQCRHEKGGNPLRCFERDLSIRNLARVVSLSIIKWESRSSPRWEDQGVHRRISLSRVLSLLIGIFLWFWICNLCFLRWQLVELFHQHQCIHNTLATNLTINMMSGTEMNTVWKINN